MSTSLLTSLGILLIAFIYLLACADSTMTFEAIVALGFYAVLLALAMIASAITGGKKS